MIPDTVEATLAPLLVLTVQTAVVQSVTGTPLGDRMIVDVVSGSFEGPGLTGRVLPSGGDWLIRTPNGSRLDVRMLLDTADGVTLLFRYSGRASQKDGRPRIEVAGSFEAPAGALRLVERCPGVRPGCAASRWGSLPLFPFRLAIAGLISYATTSHRSHGSARQRGRSGLQ